MSLFDSHAMFGESMSEKLLASLPFCCSTHSAAAACEACEHAHRARRQDGATGLCHRPRFSRRHGRCSFLCCSSCRFEFSCKHNRSDADMNVCSSVFQVGCRADRCFSALCVLLCRSGAGGGGRSGLTTGQGSDILLQLRPPHQAATA